MSSSSENMLSEDINSLSFRDKSISNQHNYNYTAGYISVHGDYLNQTRIRGRKTFAFWILVILLFILAVGNLILTITILSVLRLGHGMESIEVLPDEDAIKFYGDTDFGHLYKRNGKIEGYLDEPIELYTDDGTILINILNNRNERPLNKFRLNENETIFNGFEEFIIRNDDGTTIFTTEKPEFNQIRGSRILYGKMVKTNRIASPVGNKLRLDGKELIFKGSEGTNIDGKDIVWSTDQDIYLDTSNGSIILSDRRGTFIDIRKIPIAKTKYNNYHSAQYKICVCMPQGKLFKIPIPSNPNSRVYCHHINMSPQHNPCF